MREECRHFLQGRCKFGRRCKYGHIIRTGLADPPYWIHSYFPDVDTIEIHPDEARLRFMESSEEFAREWDNLFVHNYAKLCKKMNEMLSVAKVMSTSSRVVDIRSPDVLVRILPVFDPQKVMVELRRLNVEPGNHGGQSREHARGAGRHELRGCGTPKATSRTWKSEPQGPSSHNRGRGCERGRSKDSAYVHSTERQRRQGLHGRGERGFFVGSGASNADADADGAGSPRGNIDQSQIDLTQDDVVFEEFLKDNRDDDFEIA